MLPKFLSGSDILPPTAPMGDFNNAIIDVIHARPMELIFGIPVVMLLVLTAVMLAVTYRRAR